MSEIHVPDIPGPTAPLCWQQGPLMDRCDRKRGHAGLHSWEWAVVIEKLRRELEAKP